MNDEAERIYHWIVGVLVFLIILILGVLAIYKLGEPTKTIKPSAIPIHRQISSSHKVILYDGDGEPQLMDSRNIQKWTKEPISTTCIPGQRVDCGTQIMNQTEWMDWIARQRQE